MATVVRGLTWGHTRGYLPMVAASQAYTDFNPDIEFTWDKISLRDFGEGDLESLGNAYDLLVIDYPFVGTIAAAGTIYSLNELFDSEFIEQQRRVHVGPSMDSYTYDGAVWSLPLDAATQVSASRPDLLAAHDVDSYPKDWADVIQLAKETGKVGLPLAPLAASGCFWTLCTTLGERPFARQADIVDERIGVQALALMQELHEHIDPDCFELNPIGLLGAMASTDRFMLAPVLYGYNNYSRRGYAPNQVIFRDVIGGSAEHEPAATIGGAGLAFSRQASNLDECIAFARFLVDPTLQEHVCLLSGGQPSWASVWESDHANALAGSYFRNVRRTMDNAYVRPNYPGFTAAQSRIAATIREFLATSGDPADTLATMNDIYTSSLPATA